MRSFLILAFFLAAPALFGDTGTYVIEEYNVFLSPLENGDTRIAYYQKWRVTGGNIPWITVGCPNSGFRIIKDSFEGNITSISKANTRSWSGVRIQLDNKYLEGQTFEVKFSIVQSGLLYGSKGANYNFSFIPGWYKNSGIESLNVTLEFFDRSVEIETSPAFAKSGDGALVLSQQNLRPGKTPHIKASFPKSAYTGKVNLEKTNSKNSDSQLIGVVILVMLGLILLVMILLIIIFNRRSALYGKGGRLNAGNASAIGNRGCVVSCACACVACACACACAGGGAAGCDRKMDFSCPLCEKCGGKNCSSRFINSNKSST